MVQTAKLYEMTFELPPGYNYQLKVRQCAEVSEMRDVFRYGNVDIFS